MSPNILLKYLEKRSDPEVWFGGLEKRGRISLVNLDMTKFWAFKKAARSPLINRAFVLNWPLGCISGERAASLKIGTDYLERESLWWSSEESNQAELSRNSIQKIVNVISYKFMVLRHKFNVVGHKFNVVGHESLARCFTNENESNLQKNECSSSRSGENLKVVGENERSCSRSGENTEQTEIRGKPSHDSWLESSILVLTEPSLFQSRGWSHDVGVSTDLD